MRLFINAHRAGYAPEQIRHTMTVGELIAALEEFDEDAGMLLQQLFDDLDGKCNGWRFACADAEIAGDALGIAGKFQERLVGQIDDLGGVLVEIVSRIGQRNALLPADKQLFTYLFFQTDQLAGQGGLRDTQSLGRSGDAFGLTKLQKILQHTDFHGSPSSL